MSTHFDRALVLFDQSRHELAEGELRQELAAEPENAMAHALLGLCLSERNEYQEATREAETAITLMPDLPYAHYALAVILSERDRPDEAEAAIQEAIRLSPEDADYYGLLAAIRLDQRHWQPALEAAEQGLECEPEHVGCNNYRAMALVKLGRRQEAGATIETALAHDPENALSHANQGWTLLESGNVVKAMEHFREALRLEPGHEWARQGILEALKARHIVYRLMLWYFLWMAKLSEKAQWAVIIGGYIGYRVLGEVADARPELAPWLWPLLIAYLVFVFLTWTAQPLFDLLLRLNRFGRLVLSREEIVASNWVGACVLAALIALGIYLAAGGLVALFSAIFLGLLIIPVAAVFHCPSGWPRQVMAIYTLLLFAAGLSAIGLIAAERVLFEVPAYGFLIGVFLSGWVANGLQMVRVRN
jgi:tetratricopeptide (TPR) repeat protein